MGDFAASRQRHIGRHGRTWTLTRAAVSPAPAARAEVQAFFRGYKAGELLGGLQQGDGQLETSVLPAPFTPPQKGDRALVDGRTWTVQGAVPVSEGPGLIGYVLTLRGG